MDWILERLICEGHSFSRRKRHAAVSAHAGIEHMGDNPYNEYIRDSISCDMADSIGRDARKISEFGQ